MTQTLSETAKAALLACYATRGKHKGQLLARPPKSGTAAHAAWHGAMLSVNPYLCGIGSLLFMSNEHRAIATEVTAWFDAMPHAQRVAIERNRQALESWGVW